MASPTSRAARTTSTSGSSATEQPAPVAAPLSPPVRQVALGSTTSASTSGTASSAGPSTRRMTPSWLPPRRQNRPPRSCANSRTAASSSSRWVNRCQSTRWPSACLASGLHRSSYAGSHATGMISKQSASKTSISFPSSVPDRLRLPSSPVVPWARQPTDWFEAPAPLAQRHMRLAARQPWRPLLARQRQHTTQGPRPGTTGYGMPASCFDQTSSGSSANSMGPSREIETMSMNGMSISMS